MADDLNTPSMGVMRRTGTLQSPGKGFPQNIPFFNGENWAYWLLGFLLPVILLGFIPIGKLFGGTKYTRIGFFKEIIGNKEIIMISASMMLAAIFELNAGRHIPDRKKTKFAFILNIILIVSAFLSVVIYLSATMTNVEPGKLLLEMVFKFNIFIFSISFIFGTASFFRRLLWN
jgi:hypothetical protein